MGKHPNCSYNKERSVCFELFVEKILSALKVILFEFEHVVEKQNLSEGNTRNCRNLDDRNLNFFSNMNLNK